MRITANPEQLKKALEMVLIIDRDEDTVADVLCGIHFSQKGEAVTPGSTIVRLTATDGRLGGYYDLPVQITGTYPKRGIIIENVESLWQDLVIWIEGGEAESVTLVYDEKKNTKIFVSTTPKNHKDKLEPQSFLPVNLGFYPGLPFFGHEINAVSDQFNTEACRIVFTDEAFQSFYNGVQKQYLDYLTTLNAYWGKNIGELGCLRLLGSGQQVSAKMEDGTAIELSPVGNNMGDFEVILSIQYVWKILEALKSDIDPFMGLAIRSDHLVVEFSGNNSGYILAPCKRKE